MCINHDWEVLSRHLDSCGDETTYSICRCCGETREEVEDILNR